MLPDTYLHNMKDLLKEEFDDYLASFDDEPVKSLRVNTSKISVSDFLKSFPYELEKVPWTEDGFCYKDNEVNKHPYYYAGLYYIQEASAMLPGEMLPVDEGDIVLDACAAPGGKSLKILNKLNGTGLLVSNDISASRCNALLRNIERQGYVNYLVIVTDMKNLAVRYPGYFDKIILDAPCSGEGMFRKDPSLIEAWVRRGNEYYVPVQKELITAAVKLLKEGGMLLYSTCTFSPEEDEEIVRYALNAFADLKLLPIKMHEGFTKGKDGIGVKLFPHKVKGEGHFTCLLQKGEKRPQEHIKRKADLPDIGFLKHLKKDFYNGEFMTINDKLYFVPDFDHAGIRTLRSGLLLGEITRYLFKPSQALAMSLRPDEFDQSINLDNGQALRYLKGETIRTGTDLEGYVLVCIDGYPLGFGKAAGSSIKNLID